MRARRGVLTGLVAGGLAMSLLAAGTTTPTGTASTELVGATVRVTGPAATSTASLLDVVTSATTADRPLASTQVVPLTVGDQQVGATGASSDGQGTATSDGGVSGPLGDLLSLEASPVETAASASAQQAVATVEATAGQLSALLGQLSLELETTGITSVVDADSARATQGLALSGLAVGLDDLGLGADVLGQLGLANLLALLDQLPVDAPTELAGVAGILDELAELEGAVAALDTASEPVLATIAQLGAIEDALPAVQSLDGLLGQLTALGGGDASALLTGLEGLSASLATAGCTLGDLPTALEITTDPAGSLSVLTGALDGAVACVEGALADQDTLAGLLPGQLADVVDQLDVVSGLVEQLLSPLGDLDGLLDLLPDLLDDATGLDLLSLGPVDLGTTALAADRAADSRATVGCSSLEVSVLDQTVTTPDCSEGIAQLPDVAGTVTGAVAQLTGVLNALPLADVVQVGELRAELFTDLVEEVTEADGVVTATAGITLLDLSLPSLTLDPAQVTDAVDDLGLPDVLGPVTGLLDQLEASLAGLSLPEAGAALGTVTDLADQLGAPEGLTGTVDQVGALIDGLQLGDLGSLAAPITTPGLELVVDPVSTAEFTVTASGGTAAPAPVPAPAPAAPSLPTTGGGLALVGILTLAGAAGLRRRP